MLNKYYEFTTESLLSRMDESILYYSDDFIETLMVMNTDLSKLLLTISKEDLDTNINYIDIGDSPDMITFIPDAKAEALFAPIPPPDNKSNWQRAELIDPSRAYEYSTTIFIDNGIDTHDLPAPMIHTKGWARVVKSYSHSEAWHFKADLDDPIFIESVKQSTEKANCTVPPDPTLIVRQDSFYAKDAHSPAIKIIDPKKELTKATKGRNPIKVGRVIKKLLQLAGYNNPTDSELEGFVNLYKSTYVFIKDKFHNFKLVSGEDIKHYYLHTNYFNNKKGTLGQSCMRWDKCQTFFNLYTENPNQCNLLTLTDPISGKVLGRALVWKLDHVYVSDKDLGKMTFMDRIYTYEDSMVNQFIEYAKDKGWSYKSKQQSSENFTMITPSGDLEGPGLVVELEQSDDNWEFPYVDTLKYFNDRRAMLSTDRAYISSTTKTYKLESQDGSNGYCDTCEGEGEYSCHNCRGRGNVNCDKCDGSGENECSDCQGYGTHLNAEQEEVDCSSCDGRGTIRCGECNGRGRVDCPECDGGVVTCPDCS